MNPDQFSTNNNAVPDDVLEDERLRADIRLDSKSIRAYLAERSNRDLNAEAEAMAAEIKAKAAEAATYAVQNKAQIEVTPRGRVRKNGPCPCGSGRKFKKCCLAAVKDPEDEKKLPSPKALRSYMRRPQ